MPRKVETPYSKKSASRLNIKTKNKLNSCASNLEEDENVIFSPVLVEENSWSTVESAQTLTGRSSDSPGTHEIPSAIPEEGSSDEDEEGEGELVIDESTEHVTPTRNRENLLHDDENDCEEQEMETWRETPRNTPSGRVKELMSKQLADSPIVNFLSTPSVGTNLALCEIENSLNESPKEPSFLQNTPPVEDFLAPAGHAWSRRKNKTPRRYSPDKLERIKVPGPPAKVKKTRSVMEQIQKSSKELNQTDQSCSELQQDKDGVGSSRRCHSLSSLTAFFNPIISSTPSSIQVFRGERAMRDRQQSVKITSKLFTPSRDNEAVKDKGDAGVARTPKQRKSAVSEVFSGEQRDQSCRKRKTNWRGNKNSASTISERETQTEEVGAIPAIANGVSPEEEPQSSETDEAASSCVPNKGGNDLLDPFQDQPSSLFGEANNVKKVVENNAEIICSFAVRSKKNDSASKRMQQKRGSSKNMGRESSGNRQKESQTRKTRDAVYPFVPKKLGNDIVLDSVPDPRNSLVDETNNVVGTDENNVEAASSSAAKRRKNKSDANKVKQRRDSSKGKWTQSNKRTNSASRKSNRNKKMTNKTRTPSTSQLRGTKQDSASGSKPQKKIPLRQRKLSSIKQKKEPELNDSELILRHEEEEFDCYTIGSSIVAYAPVTSSDDSLNSSVYDIQLPLCPISAMREKILNEPYHFPPL